jgi:hypothetical protein
MQYSEGQHKNVASLCIRMNEFAHIQTVFYGLMSEPFSLGRNQLVRILLNRCTCDLWLEFAGYIYFLYPAFKWK